MSRTTLLAAALTLVLCPFLRADEPTTDTPAPAPEPAEEQLFVVDGMVGQIRGKPIFADPLLKEIGEETLERLGRDLSRIEFRDQAGALIDRKLAELLYTRLEQTEAERSLTEQERMGLSGMRKLQREKYIARYGGGSVAIADARLKEITQFGLDETVDQDVRRQVLIYYQQKRINPKVFVNRREAERYYAAHGDQFNPPPTVTVSVILVADPTTADAVDAALAAGTPFADAARQYSLAGKSTGGQLRPFQLSGPLSGFNELSSPELNEHARTLAPGQHSPRVTIAHPDGERFGWVRLDELKVAEHKSLADVFLQIEDQLKQEKRDKIRQDLMRDLIEKHDYTAPDEMADALLDIAMNRYARPQ